MLTREKAFEKMIQGKKVRITSECRNFFSKGVHYVNLGQWFYIQVHRVDSVDLIDEDHCTLGNVRLEWIK